MKQLFFIASLFVSSLSLAGQSEVEIPYLIPDSIIIDSSLDSTSLLYFNFPNATDLSSLSISYSLDGVQGEHSLVTNQGDLQLEATAGHHELQFFYSSEYYEEYTTINIEAGRRYYYSVYFTSSEMIILTEKPVIYLYPEKEQEVQVNVDPAGEFTFTYPKYNDGWKVLAAPNGKLTIDENTYNYLFWEASDRLTLDEVDLNVGFTVAGSDITRFLEEKLTQSGLNSKERADFITFWGPRMASHDDVFLQFQFNKECDRYAELEIDPKPDNVYRIYMIWQPVDQLRIAPEAQEIPVMNRDGFTVLEWGGQELPSTKLVRTL